jgi:hypothetical protein
MLAEPRLQTSTPRRSVRRLHAIAAALPAADLMARPDKRQRVQPLRASELHARMATAGMTAHAPLCARGLGLSGTGGDAAASADWQRGARNQPEQRKTTAKASTTVGTRSPVTATSCAPGDGVANVQRRQTRSQLKLCGEIATASMPSAAEENAVRPARPAGRRHAIDVASISKGRQDAHSSSSVVALADPAAERHTDLVGFHTASGSRVSAGAGKSAAQARTEAPSAHSSAAIAMPKRRTVKRELAALLVGTNNFKVGSLLSEGGSAVILKLRGRCIPARCAKALGPPVPDAPASVEDVQQNNRITRGVAAGCGSAAPARQTILEAVIELVDVPAPGAAAAHEAAVAAGLEHTAGALAAALPAQENCPTSGRQSAVSGQQDEALLPEVAGRATAVAGGSAVSRSTLAAPSQRTETVPPASATPARIPPPLLPAPPRWGSHGQRSMDVAAAAATARGRGLRAVRPDYARLAATEVAATRLPVWPGNTQVRAKGA